ncbi:hypothetical protein scyTo_0025035, partial [Scyliorhinus torazame]|nr:hypothetical protein [Scyliorhinus torazame]
GELTQEELYIGVEMLSAVALIDRALEAGDYGAFWRNLISAATGLTNIQDCCAQRYFAELTALKQRARRDGEVPLSWNDLQMCVHAVNSAVEKEHDSEW